MYRLNTIDFLLDGIKPSDWLDRLIGQYSKKTEWLERVVSPNLWPSSKTSRIFWVHHWKVFKYLKIEKNFIQTTGRPGFHWKLSNQNFWSRTSKSEAILRWWSPSFGEGGFLKTTKPVIIQSFDSGIFKMCFNSWKISFFVTCQSSAGQLYLSQNFGWVVVV